MRRLDTLLHARLCGLAVALLLTLVLTLAAAGSAYGEQSREAKRQAVIQKILETHAGDLVAVKDAIKKIFGDRQGNTAVGLVQMILDALPSDISDAEWGAIKAALSEMAGQLDSAVASQSIVEKLAAKESARGKTQLLARAATDESRDEAEAGWKSSSPMAPPPQTEVVCTSENC